MNSSSAIDHAGYPIYRSFDMCVVLDQTMRQGNDQIRLLDRSLCIRKGEVTQQDWMDVNNRYEKTLPVDEQANFAHDKVISLMET